MKDRYLKVTYRHGKPLAAYLYLPRRSGDSSNHVKRYGSGFIVDFTADGRPIGVELLFPSRVILSEVNQLLEALGLVALEAPELSPLTLAG
jgi:hypothetical protein